MPPLPKAILFDLDETILSFGPRHLILQEVAEMFAERFLPFSPEDAGRLLEDAFVWYWGDPDRSKAGRFRLSEARVEAVEAGFTRMRDLAPALTSDFARTFGERFHTYREEQMKFFPGALETLETLKAKGVLLALVTNGAAEPQRAKVDHFDLARRFDHVQIEGEAGFGKPEEQAYLHAMAALGVAAHETWMVGDNLEWEVAAPQRLGIYAIWHDHLGRGLPPGSPVRPDRIIRAVAELAEGI